MEQDQLIGKIQQASTITEALRLVEKEGRLTPLSELLSGAMAAQQVSPQELAKLIDVERSTLYRLLSGERLTTRNVLLRIALMLRLSVEETQNLLRAGQRAEMYAPVRRDAVLLFAISHCLTLTQTEELLRRKGENSLFERL